jgi:hypothetical protein
MMNILSQPRFGSDFTFQFRPQDRPKDAIPGTSNFDADALTTMLKEVVQLQKDFEEVTQKTTPVEINPFAGDNNIVLRVPDKADRLMEIFLKSKGLTFTKTPIQ